MRRPGFEEFVAARSTRLLRTAYLLTHDRGLAEDLRQTSLSKVWFAWGRIDADPESCVRRILVNTYATWWRRRWNGEQPTDTLPETSPDLGHDASSVVRQDLWAAMARLPSGSGRSWCPARSPVSTIRGHRPGATVRHRVAAARRRRTAAVGGFALVAVLALVLAVVPSAGTRGPRCLREPRLVSWVATHAPSVRHQITLRVLPRGGWAGPGPGRGLQRRRRRGLGRVGLRGPARTDTHGRAQRPRGRADLAHPARAGVLRPRALSATTRRPVTHP